MLDMDDVWGGGMKDNVSNMFTGGANKFDMR